MRGRDDDAVGEMVFATAVVGEDGVRDDRSGRDTVVWLDDGFHVIGSQDLESALLRGSGGGVGVFPHEKRAIDALGMAVLTDGLRDGENMRFGEGAVQRTAPVTAGAETDHLIRVAGVGATIKVVTLELCDIDEHVLRGGLARER